MVLFWMRKVRPVFTGREEMNLDAGRLSAEWYYRRLRQIDELMAEAELPSCEARIIGFYDQAIITVRNSGDPRRRRSSICRSNDIGNPGAASQLEKQADRFATDLLMPRYLFVPSVAQPTAFVRKRPKPFANCDAQVYQQECLLVPEFAISIRLHDPAAVPSIAVLSRAISWPKNLPFI